MSARLVLREKLEEGKAETPRAAPELVIKVSTPMFSTHPIHFLRSPGAKIFFPFGPSHDPVFVPLDFVFVFCFLGNVFLDRFLV